MRVQHTRDPADQTGEEERHQPVVANLDTGRGRGEHVVSHGLEAAPERCVPDEKREPHDEDQRDRDQVVVVAGTTEVEPRKSQRRDLADARRATGEVTVRQQTGERQR